MSNERANPSSTAPGVLTRLAQLRRRQVPTIRQSELSECAAACLAMTLAYHGRHLPVGELREQLGIGRDGSNLLRLRELAQRHGLRGRGLEIDVDDLALLPAGSILHWQFRHFMVFERLTRDHVVVVDPAHGRRRIDRTSFRRGFTGVALHLEKGDAFERKAIERHGARSYLARLLQERAVVAKVVATSFVVRALALAIPLLTGLVVDHVIPRSDVDLLLLVVAGVGATVIFQALGQLMRGLLLLQLRTVVDVRQTLGFLEHMLSLPYAFFQGRQTGDLVMRAASHTLLREQVTTTAMAAVLDGVFACGYLAVIAAFDLTLAAVVLGLATVQGLVLVIERNTFIELGTRTVEARGRASGRLVQMIAGVEPLKLCGAERRAIERYSNDYVEELNAALDEGRTMTWVEAAVGGLRTLSPLVLMSLGTWMVLRGELSLGGMLTINALGAGVMGPLASLMDAVMRLQSLRGQFDRIGEVTREAPEVENADVGPTPTSGELAFERVSFSYPGCERPTLRDISFEVPAGSCVAVVGPSGSGKSTLARLLVGLYRADQGTITMGGREIGEFGLRALRRSVAVVPQRPYLFAGSIADNIALGDPTASRQRIRRAAELAGIHDDIAALPLGYDTPVAEDGGSLSGGQRKRVVVARALLGEPSVLVLDEATSDLDTAAEAALTHNLAQLACTRIVIAHRLSTIASADRILVLERGAIVEQGTHAELIDRRGAYHRLLAAQVVLTQPARVAS